MAKPESQSMTMTGLAIGTRSMQMENEAWRFGTCSRGPFSLRGFGYANPVENSSVCHPPAFPRASENINPIELGRASTY